VWVQSPVTRRQVFPVKSCLLPVALNESSNNDYVQSREPIYLCRLIIEKTISDVTIIPPIIHTIITRKVYISNKKDIVTFGKSEEEAKKNCRNIINDLDIPPRLQQEINNLEKEIDNHDRCICKIVSPWN